MEDKVQKPIIEVSLEREIDLVIAYKKAMQLAEITGMNFTEQTKFATAVSEICRNALTYANDGMASFYIAQDGPVFFVEAIVSDTGPGIDNIEALLSKIEKQTEAQRTGIFNCRRLSDNFVMESDKGKGTCVRIGRRLPANHPAINNKLLAEWRKHFSQLSPASPYDELKRQNHLLLKTLEELKLSKGQVQEQLEEIRSLNSELEQKNEALQKFSAEYARQNELLKKRNKDLDEFAHIVSHDLKGPIYNLQGLLQLQEMRQDSTPVPVELFKKQFQKMENLIDNILTYSRAGHDEMPKKEVDVHRLLQELTEGLSRPRNFQIEIAPDLPSLFTEEIFVFQVFSNLLINAIKYNDKEEGRIKVGFEQMENGRICYYVEDNGRGIPPAKREKVFKMFTVLHKIKGVVSTGIGLSIVKKIVQEKGGEVWIEDSKYWSGGCRFCITWPEDQVI